MQRSCRGVSISHIAIQCTQFSIPGLKFCNRSYGNITYVGAHNSYAVGVNNRKSCVAVSLLFIAEFHHAVFANQDYNSKRSDHHYGCSKLTPTKVTQQLNDGVRLLQMQAHQNSGDIYLCHTACVSARTICAAEPPEEAPGIIQRRNSARLPQDRYGITYFQSIPVLRICIVKTWMDANPEDGGLPPEESGPF